VLEEDTYRVVEILWTKTCARSAPRQHLDEVLKDSHMKASQSTRIVYRSELFQVQNIKRDRISKMQVRPKVIGLIEESKVESFETLEIFQFRKKSKDQEEEHNNLHINCRGEDLDR
jgi:hypothetical protein